jgi:hypothetical protein
MFMLRLLRFAAIAASSGDAALVDSTALTAITALTT